MKRYSIGLVLAGMALIIGSCVPLVQTVWSERTTDTVWRVAITPDGGDSRLVIAEKLVSVPVLRLVPPVGTTDGPGTVRYTFSIRDAAGRPLLEESGTTDVEPPLAGSVTPSPPVMVLRFPETTIPPGRWFARLDTGPAAGLIQEAELRLPPPSPGLMPALLTSLVIAILGWLAASLGALQWIRAEAARPVDSAGHAGPVEQERLWTVGCHLSPLLGYLLPFGHVIGPLALWLAKRQGSPGVEKTGRDVLNFQLSITLYVLAALLLSFFLIGLAILFLVVVFHFTMALYASLRAQRGLETRYPLTMGFV